MTIKEARKPNSHVVIACKTKKEAKILIQANSILYPNINNPYSGMTYFGFTEGKTYYSTTSIEGVIYISDKQTFIDKGEIIYDFEDITDINDYKESKTDLLLKFSASLLYITILSNLIVKIIDKNSNGIIVTMAILFFAFTFSNSLHRNFIEKLKYFGISFIILFILLIIFIGLTYIIWL